MARKWWIAYATVVAASFLIARLWHPHLEDQLLLLAWFIIIAVVIDVESLRRYLTARLDRIEAKLDARFESIEGKLGAISEAK